MNLRTKRGLQKRIRDWVELLGKKEVEIVRLKNFPGQGSEINFRFRSTSVWRKRRWPGGWLPCRFSSRHFAFRGQPGMTRKSERRPKRDGLWRTKRSTCRSKPFFRNIRSRAIAASRPSFGSGERNGRISSPAFFPTREPDAFDGLTTAEGAPVRLCFLSPTSH